MKKKSNPSTSKSSNSPKTAKNSRQNWLNSLKIGDTVWRTTEWPIEELEELECFTTKEEFTGWFSFDKSRKSAMIRCAYNGRFEVLTEHLFPNKKEAQKAAAPKILKDLKRIRASLKGQQKQLDKHYQRWLILANQ